MRTPQWLIKVSLALLHTFVSCDSVIQLGPDNEETFIKFYGGAFDQTVLEVIPAIDGGYLMVGSTSSPSEGEESDIYIVKTGSSGNEIWSKSFSFEGRNDTASTVIAFQGESYVIIGSSYLQDEADAFILWIDKLGNQINSNFPYLLDSANQEALGLRNGQETGHALLLDESNTFVLGGEMLYDGQWDSYLWRFTLDLAAVRPIRPDTNWQNFRRWGYPGNERLSQILPLPQNTIGVLVQTKYSPQLQWDNLLLYQTNSKGIPLASQVLGTNDFDLAGNIFQRDSGFALLGTKDTEEKPFIVELDANFQQIGFAEIEIDNKVATQLISFDGYYFILGVNTQEARNESFFLLKAEEKGPIVEEIQDFGQFPGAAAGNMFLDDESLIACGTVRFGNNQMACLIKVNTLDLTPYPQN